ncbi:MAG: 2,3-bisphosphoglycerate-independent phosphoglycerate mutase [Acidobacteriota bacterium]
MNHHVQLISRLARPGESKIVLLVLDGVGDIRTAEQPQTALDAARIPNLDALAAGGALGRIVPVAQGITPGSGPGHLALFGFDPTEPTADIGRGVLEALGEGIQIRPGDIAARGNFATADAAGNLTDRRAGRIPTEECVRLVAAINAKLKDVREIDASVYAGEGHRFVLLLKAGATPLDPNLADTDPQQIGVPPLPVAESAPFAASTAAKLRPVVEAIQRAIANEPRANRALLRGFATVPHLPSVPDLYHMRCGAFAGYPLYRGVAAACGMDLVPCGKSFAETVAAVREHWSKYDFFFLHVKKTDMAGEDGDLATKIHALEDVDAILPELLALGPDVVAITGDHSTPAPMKGHSWHPVPLLLWSKQCYVDDCKAFTESAAIHGAIGTVRSSELMGLMLANAGRLAKYGA